MKLLASSIVGTGFPTAEGHRLAMRILGLDGWERLGLIVALDGLPAALLVGGFIHAVLQTIYDESPDSLEPARRIIWVAPHGFQNVNIERWVSTFEPNTTKRDDDPT